MRPGGADASMEHLRPLLASRAHRHRACGADQECVHGPAIDLGSLSETSMAEAQAAFPPPPPYYLLFRGEEVPTPPPPVSGEYASLGELHNTDLRPHEIEESGIRQFFPEGKTDARGELRRLGKELAILILEMVDTLVERPSSFARRVEDVSEVFKNIHLLLNALRPQQARITIVHILETQLELRRKALADIKDQRQNARRLLSRAAEDLETAHLITGEEDVDVRMEEQ